MEKNKLIDLRKLVCPFSLIAARKEVNDLARGDVAEILVADSSTCESISTWAEDEGNKVIEVKKEGDYFRIILKKK